MARRSMVLVSKTLYQVGVISVLGALCWVGVSMYHALVKPPAVEVTPEILAPINPVIDQAVIASLSGRLFVAPESVQPASVSGEQAP